MKFKIIILGGGMVGSAIVNNLESNGYDNLVFTNLNKIVHLPEIKVLLINENEYSADFLMNYSEILFSMPTN